MKTAPFLLEPVLKPKPWGGRSLERLFGRAIAENEKIGESWELSARAGDSCLIASGPLSGKTLREAIGEYPTELLGEEILSVFGPRLPLLAKFIDAADRLSIQVHPDDCLAKALGESDSGKEEVWYVLDARPGASLVLGTVRELAFEELVELCRQGRYGDCLNFVQVEGRDVIAVPPGTLHAVGKGIVLYEVSQNSDITYRINDWNREIPGRELARDKAREALVCKPPAMPKRHKDITPLLAVLHEARHFRLLEACPGNGSIKLEGGVFNSVTVVEGCLEIKGEGVSLELAPGNTAFIPASVGTAVIKGQGRGVITIPVVTKQNGKV